MEEDKELEIDRCPWCGIPIEDEDDIRHYADEPVCEGCYNWAVWR